MRLRVVGAGLWRRTHSTTVRNVRVRNSLVKSEEPFTTLMHGDVPLTWYSCGPTVYDQSHIGHARTYVCTDIIRRILTDVFGYRLNFALGLTDIDDKIIDRAGRVKRQGDRAATLTWPDMVAFARHWEAEFFQDLHRLGVKPPDAVLRVTEHMEEILLYVQRLLDTDRAYTTEDGIYFDVGAVAAYDKFGHVPPEAEGSASPSSVVGRGNKRGPRDFALWKFSKPGEPSYDTSLNAGTCKIAPGRPGWHIECSAMTHAYFGPHFDLHSGGVDLKFPHHTNEIAQCEAHNCNGHHGTDAGAPTQQWVQTWLHTGHIYIEGRKMSKSLKNFISIRDFLASAEYGRRAATDFRIYCLQHRYSTNLHFGPERIHEAATYRHRLENFCRLVAALGAVQQTSPVSKPSDESRQLLALLHASQAALLAALADDFDTPVALRIVSDLVGRATLYTSAAHASRGGHSVECLLAVEDWVTRCMGLLGVDIKAASGGSGGSGGSSSSSRSSSSSSDSSSAAIGERERQLVDTLVHLRASARQAGLGGMQLMKAAKAEGKADVDQALSSLRDVVLACDEARVRAKGLGIQIDDVGQTSTWRPAE